MFKKILVAFTLLLFGCTWCTEGECPYISEVNIPKDKGLITVSVSPKQNSSTSMGNYSKIFTDLLIEEIKTQGVYKYIDTTSEEKADYEINLHAYASEIPTAEENCTLISSLTLGILPCWGTTTYYFDIDITDNQTEHADGFSYQQSIKTFTHLFALFPLIANQEKYGYKGVAKAITSQILEKINQYIFYGGIVSSPEDSDLIITDIDNVTTKSTAIKTEDNLPEIKSAIEAEELPLPNKKEENNEVKTDDGI